MKKFVIILLALAVGVAGFNADAKKRKTSKRTAKRTIVEPAPTGYDYVQTSDAPVAMDAVKYPPEYPGGTSGLMKFLADNIKYPKSAEKQGIQGKVILQFVIEKTGAISGVKVVRSVNPALDAEAVRVVKKIKRFVPGYDADHAPVRVMYTLPVNFKLN